MKKETFPHFVATNVGVTERSEPPNLDYESRQEDIEVIVSLTSSGDTSNIPSEMISAEILKKLEKVQPKLSHEMGIQDLIDLLELYKKEAHYIEHISIHRGIVEVKGDAEGWRQFAPPNNELTINLTLNK
jgi:hypothetical protein